MVTAFKCDGLHMSHRCTLALLDSQLGCSATFPLYLQFQKLGAQLCGSWTQMPTCTTLQASNLLWGPSHASQHGLLSEVRDG